MLRDFNFKNKKNKRNHRLKKQKIKVVGLLYNQHNNLIIIFCTHDHMLIQFKILISMEKHHNCVQSIEPILTFKRTAVVDFFLVQFMPKKCKNSSAPFF